jgi:DNA-binding LytR/AlgR family response regulator
MKHEIKFYRLKMEIPVIKGNVSRYYSDLVYIEHDKPLSILYFSDGSKYTIEITLRQLMINLPCKAFFQCNRNNIINICRYEEYREEQPSILMDNKVILKLSHRKIKYFKKQKAELMRISPLCNRCLTCSNINCPDLLMFCREINTDEQ